MIPATRFKININVVFKKKKKNLWHDILQVNGGLAANEQFNRLSVLQLKDVVSGWSYYLNIYYVKISQISINCVKMLHFYRMSLNQAQ